MIIVIFGSMGLLLESQFLVGWGMTTSMVTHIT